MTDFLNLRSGVGPDEDNRDDDVASVRNGLTELSFEPPKMAPDPLHTQVTDFQADTGLRVDGRLNPSGETEQKVNNELSRKRARDRRTLGGMLGDADIEHPVGTLGTGRRNRRQDLVKSRDVLDKVGAAPGTPAGAPKPRLANAVALGLRRFQRNVGLKADGIMAPGGPTQAALRDKLAENGLAAPPPELDRHSTGKQQRPGSTGRQDRTEGMPAKAAATKNDVAKEIAALTLFERDGILLATGLEYEPDPMGRLGQGRWLDTDGEAISGADVKAILTEAVARRGHLVGGPGADADAVRTALMREAGFRYDAGRGLWTNAGGETLTGTEAETALEAARRQAEAVLQGHARLDDLRAGRTGFAPAVAAPLGMLGGAGGVLIVVAAAIALKIVLDAHERNRRQQQGRGTRPAPPSGSNRQALPEKDREPTPLKGPDPSNPPKVPDRLPGRPVLPPDMPPTPGFEPADMPNLIEILPDDRENLPQFIILTANQFGRLGSPEVRQLNITIRKETLAEGERIAKGFKLKSGGGGPEEKLEQQPGASTFNFPDTEIEFEPTERKLFINTVSTLVDGQTLTIAEFDSGVNLVYNKGDGNFLLIIPKFRAKDLNRPEFRKFIRPILEEMTKPVPLDDKGRAIMKDRMVFQWRNPSKNN